MSDLADKFDIEKEPNGEHEEKSEDKIDGPDTDPHGSQFELLRAAYVEHGKKIGSLEDRMETMHMDLLSEMNDLKEMVTDLTSTLRKQNDKT